MKLSTYPQLLTKRKKEAKKEKLATTNNCQLFLGRDMYNEECRKNIQITLLLRSAWEHGKL